MDGPIVSRVFVITEARRAIEAGKPLHDACPWPPGTAAGQAFQLEFHAQQALQGAARGHEEVSNVQS